MEKLCKWCVQITQFHFKRFSTEIMLPENGKNKNNIPRY